MPDIDDLPSLQRQLGNKQETLLLIQERKSEYALSTDVPLDLIREERDVQEEIAALEAKIKVQEQRRRAPGRRASPGRPQACVRRQSRRWPGHSGGNPCRSRAGRSAAAEPR